LHDKTVATVTFEPLLVFFGKNLIQIYAAKSRLSSGHGRIAFAQQTPMPLRRQTLSGIQGFEKIS
jgi:hypothetical protein